MDHEAARLEQLWAGEFGDAYTERNREAARLRDTFWTDFLARYPVETVLEVGCNLGANVRWIASILPPENVWGIDINEGALQRLRRAVPGVHAIRSAAREIPLPDAQFDLVFSACVLIHQPEDTLTQVMAEMLRLSRRYVLCAEYYAEQTVEVPYRDQSGALFKRPYGELFQRLTPTLRLLETRFLSHDQGWDDVTYWLFEKST